MRVSALRVLFALIALALISACAGRFPSWKHTEWAYTKDNGLVHEGMTRRQVYAVARPVKVPRAYPPTLASVVGIPFYWYHREVHDFSEGRAMDILYRRANIREYRSVPLHPRDLNEMLYGPFGEALPLRSEENPRDVVHRVSAIRRKGAPLQKPGEAVVIDGSEATGMYDQVFINPPSKSQNLRPLPVESR